MKNKGQLAGIIVLVVSFIVFSVPIAILIAPKGKISQMGDLTLFYRQDKHGRADNPHLVMAKVTSSADPLTIRVALFYYREFEFHRLALERLPGTDYFGVEMPAAPLGNRTYYYLEATDGKGNKVLLPQKTSPDFESKYKYFQIRYEGTPTFTLFLLHIILMLATLFLIIHALFYALYYLQTGEKDVHMLRAVNWGVLTFFITGFPIGWIIEKQVLGNYWEGVPFGWDITDNKTLIIFILWLVFIILQKSKKISPRSYAKWIIINTIITIILFLIPHSI